MNGFNDSLDNLKIASPCPASWEQMTGDDRVRFCQQCKLKVHNLSSLTRAEAQQLVNETEGRLCVRLYRRTDGTVLTSDCPVGLQRLKKRIAGIAAIVVTTLLSGLAWAKSPLISSFYRGLTEHLTPVQGQLVPLQGSVVPPEEEVGRIALPHQPSDHPTPGNSSSRKRKR